MDKIFGNITAAFRSEQDMGDGAGFIDEILFIVGIALAAVAISNWIGGAAMNKGADIAACIEGMSVSNAGASQKSCAAQNHAGKNNASITKDASYKNRFG